MTAPLDETDFVDRDLQAGQKSRTATVPSSVVAANPGIPARPPTREELEARADQAQSRIVELKRAQEELERERVALEEARRRRQEFETGRVEMLQHLTRGVGLLEKAEMDARRDAEQMAKTLVGFREALDKLQAIKEDSWTAETWGTELTKALTVVENARMEWNAASLKWLQLTNPLGNDPAVAQPAGSDLLGQRTFGEWCRIGFALTWPLALVTLLALGLLGAVLLRR